MRMTNEYNRKSVEGYYMMNRLEKKYSMDETHIDQSWHRHFPR